MRVQFKQALQKSKKSVGKTSKNVFKKAEQRRNLAKETSQI